MLLRITFPLLLRRSVHIIVESGKGNLRVDHDSRIIGIIYQHIGLEFPALLRLYRIPFHVADPALHFIMHSAPHPGTVQKPVKEHLTEIPLELHLPGDGIGQFSRLLTYCRRLLHNHLYRSLELGIVPYAFGPRIVQAPVESSQTLAEGLQQSIYLHCRIFPENLRIVFSYFRSGGLELGTHRLHVFLIKFFRIVDTSFHQEIRQYGAGHYGDQTDRYINCNHKIPQTNV